MNLEARKIEFVKEFLSVESEDIISHLESILRNSKNPNAVKNSFKPMTEDELNKRIDQSEEDFKNNRFKTSAELLRKFE